MLYWFFKIVLSPVMFGLFRVRVRGTRKVPRHGAAIFAANHNSFCDSFFLPLIFMRRLTFVAKAEYFDDWKTAWFFKAAGQIPIRREGGSASQGALEAAKDVLRANGLFAIYPEGTRSPDGNLYKGHTGVARLALECKAPVYPVALLGTREAQPIGKTFMKLFSRIEIKVGDPIDFFARYGDRCEDPIVLRQITDEVMFEIAKLSGQKYVNTYASRGPKVQKVTPVVERTSSDEMAGAAGPVEIKAASSVSPSVSPTATPSAALPVAEDVAEEVAEAG